MPDSFFGPVMEAAGVRLPPMGEYAVGQVFLPKVGLPRAGCCAVCVPMKRGLRLHVVLTLSCVDVLPAAAGLPLSAAAS